MAYNATIWTADGGVSVCELDDKGFILKSNSCWTGYEGTQLFDSIFRKNNKILRIERDNCKGYKDLINGLDLPPTYKI